MQRLLEKGRIPFLFAIAGLTLLFAYHCLSLRVDEENRTMDADDPTQESSESEFRALFDVSDGIFVVVWRSDLLEEKGRALIHHLVDDFTEIEGIQRVSSLVDSNFEISPSQVGTLVSEDSDATGILLDLEDKEGSLVSIIAEVESVVAKYSTADTRIAITGLPVQKYEAGKLVRRDQKFFAPLSLLVLGLILLAITRRFSGLVFPLLVSILTICWTLGIFAWLGNELNMITSLLPPVIMTLSVATTIHIYLDWLYRDESDRLARIVASVRNLYRPCLFASLTTAIGFLSLLLCSTPAVRIFGLYAALGVGISYFLGVIGIAVGLSFLSPPRLSCPTLGNSQSILDRLLSRVAEISVRHPWQIVLLTIIFAVLSAIGLSRIESDTDLLHFLGNESQLVRDTESIDESLDGVSTLEVFLNYLDDDTEIETGALERFEEAVQEIPHVRRTLSFLDFVPESALDLLKTGLPLKEILSRGDFGHFVGENGKNIRISVYTDSIGSSEGETIVERIRSSASETLGEKYDVKFAGGFYRVIVDSNRLVKSQLKSFLVAICLILLAIGLVFRSSACTFLATIPNVLPLLMTGAVMGFSGIALSTGTAMIASVVIGLAVDDTIHYLSSYRKSTHPDAADAIRKTTRSTGFVLLSTTVALSAGFWVAVFGSFQPTIYFALLSGMTMWFALACDLIVLPAFLIIAAPLGRRGSGL